MRRRGVVAVLALTAALTVGGAGAERAQANLPGAACSLLGTIGEGWMGKICHAGEKALGVAGKAKGVAKKVAGVAGKVAGNGLVERAAGIAAITAAALGGARFVLSEMSKVISSTTEPALSAGWFSSRYLRLQALAALMTLPFLAAAAVQALMRQDLGLLARAAFEYLPLAALATAVAVPVTMMLLAASDQLSAVLARAAGQDTQHFFSSPGTIITAALATAIDPFVAGLAGCLIVAAGFALWVELEVRAVAVYVVVMMLPLVFAVMVWPSRRMWAIRTAEVLIALIFSKVAIVAVLSIGAAAIGHGGGDVVVKVLAGIALLTLGVFAPWVLLRLIPLAEIASSTVGHVRGQIHGQAGTGTPEQALASRAVEHGRGWSDGILARMRNTADVVNDAPGPPARAEPPESRSALPAPSSGDGEGDGANATNGTANGWEGSRTAALEDPQPPSPPVHQPASAENGNRDGWAQYADALTQPGERAPRGLRPAANRTGNRNGAGGGWEEFAEIIAGPRPATPPDPPQVPPDPPSVDPPAEGEL